MEPEGKTSSLDLVRSKCSAAWKHILEGKASAGRERRKLSKELDREIPADAAIVVFGSLARGEWTGSSDLDWALLVDGQADESHLTVAQRVRKTLTRLSFKSPGPTGVFGGPAFSHELIHRIGGDSDSNLNTTRRVLLLLESANVGSGGDVRDRVVRQLLKRYVEDDHGYHPRGERKPHVPRFLLNDIVRFWRTMAVDFAAKRRERRGEEWALRRFKLRMSRKLIFVAGLSACLSCELRPSGLLQGGFDSDGDFCSAMTEHLLEFVQLTPLEILARMIIDHEAYDGGCQALQAYDDFLGVLSDEDKRGRLASLSPGDDQDRLFVETNDIAHDFQEALMKVFFKTSPDLTKCTQRYGVF